MVKLQLRCGVLGSLTSFFAAIRRSCGDTRWSAATAACRLVTGCCQVGCRESPSCGVRVGRRVGRCRQGRGRRWVDFAVHGRAEAFDLGGAEVAFEDAALDVVQVLSTDLEHAGVAFRGGVVHDDDVQGSPPDPERLVGNVFEAGAGESQGFQVDQFVVGDGSLQLAVVDGGGEVVSDGVHDQFSACLAARSLV